MAARTKSQPTPVPAMQWHRGGCHCGAVAFEVATPDEVELIDCNCSMCAKTGYLHLIVPKSRFRLLRGEDSLTTYTFNTGAAKHMFCQEKSSQPYGFSVMRRENGQK